MICQRACAIAATVSASLAVGCLPEVQPPKRNSVAVRDVSVSDGVALETACVPQEQDVIQAVKQAVRAS